VTSALAARLHKNHARLIKTLPPRVSCFRLYDKDIAEHPFAIDLYVDERGAAFAHVVAFVPLHGWSSRARVDVRALVLAALHDIVDASRVVLKFREKQQGGAVAADKDTIGAAVPDRIIVVEGDARFVVDLTSRTDVGLFLDHRPERLRVGKSARGRSLLNLFAYTCAFSVHAGVGGASRTVSVDLSNTALATAADNFQQNGMSSSQHLLVNDDAMRFVGACAERFDTVICDPPSFSRSKSAAEFDVQRDHVALLSRCLSLLTVDGELLFLTNLQSFSFQCPPSARAADITAQSVPPDFSKQPPAHRAWRLVRTRSQAG
jgi:23S rRNA (guanine2445-N2)-methyltransferase / 23S rRNA (guanine2069-N7)-methyltransferase